MDRKMFGDYIVYVDESGDHSLQHIDSQYPLFVLVFILIKKQDYYEKIIPEFLKFKFKYWGHDQVIFHEHDIRKEKASFAFLRTDSTLRENFYKDMNNFIEKIPFECIASVIKKEELKSKYPTPYNPYTIGMRFCMEEILQLLLPRGQKNKIIHIIVESRGSQEDKTLELEFRRICDNEGQWGYKRHNFKDISFEIIFSDKKCNSSGLQLADLIARPIGLNALRPEQPNRSFNIIKNKLIHIKSFP